MGDSCSIGDSSLSDAREEPKDNQKTDRAHRRTKDTPARKIERCATRIPLTEISKEALEDARKILKAFDRTDEITAVRAAQLAQLLRRYGRAHLLAEALSRIERVRRTRVIHHPIPYLIVTVLSVDDQSKLGVGEAERELAAKVLCSPASSSYREEEESQLSASSRRWKGYEWLLEPKATQQLEDIPPTPPAAAPSVSEENSFEISELEEPTQRQFPSPVSSPLEEQLAMIDPAPEQLASEPQAPMRQEQESEPPAHDEQAAQGAADEAWAKLVEALAARHEEDMTLNGGWFGRYRLANLSGSTLIVYLFDAPICDFRSLKTTGRTAELTRKRYGEELSALWRELSGDEQALLELRSDRP